MDTIEKRFIRKASDRGEADHGWLRSRHSFSFANYYDPEFMEFGSLRVINEDIVAAGKGFGTHPHRNMEIISYVISGELEHKDDFGNGRVIRAGEFQYMSAGSGVLHSEFNPSSEDSTHFLQIWIQPSQGGGEPRYAERATQDNPKLNELLLIASPDGACGSIAIRQEAEIHFGRFEAGETLSVKADTRFSRRWIQLISGKAADKYEAIETGDGYAMPMEDLELKFSEKSEFILFNLT